MYSARRGMGRVSEHVLIGDLGFRNEYYGKRGRDEKEKGKK